MEAARPANNYKRLGESWGRARSEGDSRYGGGVLELQDELIERVHNARMRGAGADESMRKCAERSASFAAVTQRRRLAVVLRRQRQIVLGMREAVQHRCVLRKQQRDDEQQVAEGPVHVS